MIMNPLEAFVFGIGSAIAAIVINKITKDKDPICIVKYR